MYCPKLPALEAWTTSFGAIAHVGGARLDPPLSCRSHEAVIKLSPACGELSVTKLLQVTIRVDSSTCHCSREQPCVRRRFK
jgi:hypothetical protein